MDELDAYLEGPQRLRPEYQLNRLRDLIATRSSWLPERNQAALYIGSEVEQHDIDEVLETLERFTIGDSGDKAIALVAVAQRIGRRVSGPRRVIEKFDELEAQIAEMRKALPPEHALQGDE